VTTESIPGTELVLGDKVLVLKDAYGWATVVKLEGNDATVHRVYVHIADFSYTGGVLSYVGTEKFTLALEGRSYDVCPSTHRLMTKPGALK